MELHFDRATDPNALAAKLNGSLFFQRNQGVATVHGCNLQCSFGGAVTKQKLMQACAETFRRWAKDASLAYADHHVIEKRPATTQSAASMPEAGPANQLARRTGVEDIKALAQGLTRSECHSLAVYFALLTVEPVQGDDEMQAILAWKLRASQAFLGPAADWASEIGKHVPAVQPPLSACQCRCGCPNRVPDLTWCMRRVGRLLPECNHGNGRRAVCADCLHRNGGCHVCAGTPRTGLIVPPVPKKPEFPIERYFNAPDDKPWITKTRDAALDPKLVRIDEVLKTSDLSSAKSCSVRPHGWQRTLVARCVLADSFGGQCVTSIRWPALLENATWARLDVVRFVQDWLPSNLGYVGKILHPQPRMVYTPPAPSTPWPFESSTVQIEEVSEDELCDDDRLEVQALLDSRKRKRDDMAS